MFLLDFAIVSKGGKEFRIATFFDPLARRKVVTKFLDSSVTVPSTKIVSQDELPNKKSVEVQTDLQGNVTAIK